MNKLHTALVLLSLSFGVGCGGTTDETRLADPVKLDPQGVDLYDCEAVTEVYEFMYLSGNSAFDGAGNIREQNPVNFYTNNDESNPSRALTESEKTVQKLKREPCNCYPDVGASISERKAPGSADIRPVEGGAPSLNSETLCEESERSLNFYVNEPGFSGWGMVFGGTFNGVEAEEIRDATDWDGIAVWIKRSEDTPPIAMFAGVVDRYTTAAKMFCQDSGLLENSCDAFGVGVGFDTRWRLALLPFDEMAQRGFGYASPLGHIELDALEGFSFYLPSGVWDVRIDELSYYRKK